MQLTRRLAWLGLALLEERALEQAVEADAAEAREAQPVHIEVHGEPVLAEPVLAEAVEQPIAPPAPLPRNFERLTSAYGTAERHLQSASRTYAASQLRSNVERLTGEDAPKADRPSRRAPLASA